MISYILTFVYHLGPPDLDCSYIQTKIECCPPVPHRFDREGMAWDVNRNYYIKKGKYSERQVLSIDTFYLKKSDIDVCFVFLLFKSLNFE